jgi:maltose/moltooligosaccharide transporter
MSGENLTQVQKQEFSDKKPRLSFWQIWNMSFGFLGIQFGFALQNANVSRIFETLGADVENLSLYWLAAPVTGLLIQPIVGFLSDRTWHPVLGRRRPFFLVGAILASIALLVMPNSPLLWVAVGTLWILDASINISMEPFRAFVGDLLPNSQQTAGFAMQTFFIGVGSVVASGLPYALTNWVGLSNTAPEGIIPPSVTWAFYIGAIIFILSVLWTVIRSKEYSDEEIREFGLVDESEYKVERTEQERILKGKRQFRYSFLWMLLGVGATFFIYSYGLDPKLYIFSTGLLLFGVLMLVAGALQIKKRKNMLTIIINDFQDMPLTMKQLAAVQFFSWFALFAMWIYTTSGVSRHYYDMDMSKEQITSMAEALEESSLVSEVGGENILERLEMYGEKEGDKVTMDMKIVKYFMNEDRTSSMALSPNVLQSLERVQKEYNKGADWVGILFAIYNGVAAIFAFLLPPLAVNLSRKGTHMACLLIGGAGFLSMMYFTNPQMLIASMVAVGIAWASILSMPYAILAGAVPVDKMGYYMGIFNFFIVIPQIVAASLLGYLLQTFFDTEPIYAFLIGGLSLLLAGGLALVINDSNG